jgi:hypothetical protein
MIALPDAPNMYWAIAALPHPLIDQRESMEFESGMIRQIYPYLKDAETANRSPGEWRKLVIESFLELHQLTGDHQDKPKPLTEDAAEELMSKVYEAAKRKLSEDSSADKLHRPMPPGQAIAIFTARSYRSIYDEIFKCTLLPPAEALENWNRSEEKLRQNGFLGPKGWNEEMLPAASILLPSMPQVWYAPVRVERQLASLRVIEALRMHAAKHGKLPESLDEVNVAMVPKDPLFGKPFEYRKEGDKFVLTNLPRPGLKPGSDVYYRYELRMKK